MTLRKLTEADIKQIANDLATHVHWQAYRDFALRAYGDHAHTIECHTYGEYDDEGGTDYYVESAIVRDKDGNELKPDISLPYFQERTASTLAFRQSNSYWIGRDIAIDEDDYDEWVGDLIRDLPLAHDDEYTFTVIVSEPPKLPTIYIDE